MNAILSIIVVLFALALSAVGALFALPSNQPGLVAKPGTDEVGKWYCDRCGSANPDQNMFCQWC
jgi:hypothetical protein